MAAIVPTFGRISPRAATFTLPTTAGTDTVSNAALVAGCAPGPLKALLQGTYANVAAFLAAANAQGLSVSQTGGVDAQLVWVAAASTPSLSITAAAIGVTLFRISLAHTVNS